MIAGQNALAATGLRLGISYEARAQSQRDSLADVRVLVRDALATAQHEDERYKRSLRSRVSIAPRSAVTSISPATPSHGSSHQSIARSPAGASKTACVNTSTSSWLALRP